MEIKERKISELIPAEYNPRRLTIKQFDDLKESLLKFGFVDPVIVNMHPTRRNIVIGGHQRLKAWTSLEHKTVPVVELYLLEAEERELNVRLNKNSGSFDFDMLANHFSTDDLLNWGFEEFELGIGDIADTEEDEDEKESVTRYDIVIACENEAERLELFAKLEQEGYNVGLK